MYTSMHGSSLVLHNRRRAGAPTHSSFSSIFFSISKVEQWHCYPVLLLVVPPALTLISVHSDLLIPPEKKIEICAVRSIFSFTFVLQACNCNWDCNTGRQEGERGGGPPRAESLASGPPNASCVHVALAIQP